jgi:hypothetical protein
MIRRVKRVEKRNFKENFCVDQHDIPSWTQIAIFGILTRFEMLKYYVTSIIRNKRQFIYFFEISFISVLNSSRALCIVFFFDNHKTNSGLIILFPPPDKHLVNHQLKRGSLHIIIFNIWKTDWRTLSKYIPLKAASRRQSGDKQQVSLAEPASIRCHPTKFSCPCDLVFGYRAPLTIR